MKIGIIHIWKSLFYSINGLYSTFKNEIAFRIELVMALVLIPIAMLLKINLTEKLILVFVVLLVIIVELINTAIESAIDRISFDNHDLSKRAKDAGSAAVLISLIILIINWITICFNI